MEEFDLINHLEFNNKLNTLNCEFDNLLLNDLQLNSNVVSIANWIEKFLLFIQEVKEGESYIKRNSDFESFLHSVAEKYPFYKNSKLFDPESLFSEKDLITWEKANEYLREYNIQNNYLGETADELILDFYLNKIKKIEFISFDLIALFRLKNQIKQVDSRFDEVIDYLEKCRKNKIDESEVINPYPDIFVNGNSFNLYVELCETIKAQKNKIIIADVIFIIYQLKRPKYNAIKSEVSLTFLCNFINDLELTRGLDIKEQNFKDRSSKRREQIFERIIKKYQTPFIEED